MPQRTISGLVAVVLAALGAGIAPAAAGAAEGDVPFWGYNLSGTRFAAAEKTITSANVSRLKLKWAYVIPNALGQQSQPAVVGNSIYFGGRNGVFYALDRRTGHKRWSLDTKRLVSLSPTPNSIATLNALRDGPAVVDGVVYFGDSRGDVFAVKAGTGKVRWIKRVETNPFAIMTSSPIVFDGRVIIGVSSNEEAAATAPQYPCCTFRGSLVALSTGTGRVLWRHVTSPVPRPTGAVPGTGTGPVFAPSGVAVWASPALDPRSGTVFVGTGNDYTGNSARSNSMLAINARTGKQRWVRKLSKPETWNFQCAVAPGVGNCPNPGSDFDFGAGPNLFRLGRRTLVGEGQKSGFYHVLDARTGKIVWQDQLSKASGLSIALGLEGIQWGTSVDGHRVYVATNVGHPGTVFALNPANGKVVWRHHAPPNGCTTGGAALQPQIECQNAFPAPVSSSPGIVWEGGQDGKMRAYSSRTGQLLWHTDTVRPYRGVNGLLGKGGSIDAAGAVISHGMLYQASGYVHFGVPITEIEGNVMLAFGLP
jgi:polyvinyl alcohol dehydrogenase (cytochrome)